jgi:hypothetical protein
MAVGGAVIAPTAANAARTPRAVSPPALKVVPTISGTHAVGGALTTTGGTFSGSGRTDAIKLARTTHRGIPGAAIAGATVRACRVTPLATWTRQSVAVTARTRPGRCIFPKPPTKTPPTPPVTTPPVTTPPVTTPPVTTPPVTTPPVTTPPVTTPTGSSPFFAGTFSSPNQWPTVFGTCDKALNNSEIQFTITSACNPAGDGHYRTDLCSSKGCAGNGTIASGDIYQAGQPTCTSVPVDVVNVATVSTSSWMLFAEAKDSTGSYPGWAFTLNSYYTGTNQFQISFNVYGTNNTTWDGAATPGWHTLSICTNNANNAAGAVYGIYEDGVRMTFNHGIGAGTQTLTGIPIIDNGMSSWPLVIDDYTGGTSGANTINTGAPLVSSGTNNPPMPAGGWHSA